MKKTSVEYFTDVLCVWAYGAQIRIDELRRNFPDRIEFAYRFIPVFAAAQERIGSAWKERDGAAGFSKHLCKIAADWDHVELHPALWIDNAPASSTVPHLYLKSLQLLQSTGCIANAVYPEYDGRTTFEEYLWRVRCAFFRDAENIADTRVLDRIAQGLQLPVAKIHALIEQGEAHAALHLDTEARDKYLVPGSPTLVFNEGRQRLYGNIGYRIIEANMRELLSDAHYGEASWC